MSRCSKLFQPVFSKHSFEPTKVFREGPRFYVVGGVFRGEKVIFKADLEAEAKRLPKARLRLRREAIFLRHSRFRYAPMFYSRGTHEGIFWLLEEWVSGKSQELEESSFLIKDSFFTEQNLKHLLNFLKELRCLTQISKPEGFANPSGSKLEGFVKPPGLAEVFERHFSRYSLADYIYLMRIDRPSILGKTLATKVDTFVSGCHRLFNKNQTAITHHELYGPHIFIGEARPQRLSETQPSDGGRDSFKVIDWENVGWGNLAHDFVELWIRSFAHQDFQAEFYERFRASQKEKEVFGQLFRLEMILQGIGNLSFFKHPEMPEEKGVAKEVSEFLIESIERAVGK